MTHMSREVRHNTVIAGWSPSLKCDSETRLLPGGDVAGKPSRLGFCGRDIRYEDGSNQGGMQGRFAVVITGLRSIRVLNKAMTKD